MTTLFKKLETDLTTVRLDLNALATGATGFGLVGNVDLGAPSIEGFTRALPLPDVIQPGTGRGLVSMTFRLKAKHTSMDNLLTLARSLATELDTPGPYLWHPDGQSTALYLDGFRSDLPALYRDEGQLHHFILQKLQDPYGLPVTLWRLPYLYGAQVTGTPTAVTNNPTSSKKLLVTVTGNAPTRARITLAPETGASLVSARISRRSYGNLTDFMTYAVRQGEAASFGTGATLQASESGASNNASARISFNSPEMYRRLRWTISPTDKTTIEGAFRAFVRVRVLADAQASEAQINLQLKWATADVQPATYVNELVKTTWPSTGGPWFMIDLGDVMVPRGLGTTYGLSLELWASQPSDSDYGLVVDYIQLMPVGPTPTTRQDQMSLISVRGFRDDNGADISRFYGDELVKPTSAPGTIQPPEETDGTTVVLAGDNQMVGIPPVGGRQYGTGRLTVRANVTIKRTAAFPGLHDIGTVAMRDVGPDPDVDLWTKPLTWGNGSAKVVQRRVSRSFAIPGGDPLLQAQVRFTSPDPINDEIRVHWLQTDFQRVVGNAERLKFDGEYGIISAWPAAYITDSSGVYIEPVEQEGAFIDLYPGDNLLIFDWGELPTENHEDVDERGIIPESTVGRSVTVTVSYYPRYTH